MRGSANFLVPPRKYAYSMYILLVNHQTASSCSKIREIKFCWISRDRSPPNMRQDGSNYHQTQANRVSVGADRSDIILEHSRTPRRCHRAVLDRSGSPCWGGDLSCRSDLDHWSSWGPGVGDRNILTHTTNQSGTPEPHNIVYKI